MSKKINKILSALLALFFLGVGLTVMLIKSDERPASNNLIPLDHQYTLIAGDEVKTVTLPQIIRTTREYRTVALRVRPVLPMSCDGSLSFQTVGLGIKIICEGKTLYDYEYSETENLSVYGKKWHNIPLDENYFNRELEIRFSVNAPTDTFKLPQLSYGDYSVIAQDTARHSILSGSISVIIFAIGITIGLVGIISLRNASYLKDYLWYILFCIAAALWIGANLPLVQMLVDLPRQLYKFRMTLFLLMMLFLFLHLTNILRCGNLLFRRICAYSMLAAGGTILLTAALGVLPWNIVQFLLTLAEIPVLLLLIFVNIRHMRNREKYRIFYLVLFIAILTVMLTETAFQLFTFYDRTYCVEAVLLVTLVPIIVSVLKFISSAQEAKLKKRVLEAIAFNDTLTGLYNRAMFDGDVAELQSGTDLSNTYIAVFDVNDLKKTNDAYGHSVGDLLIQSAAAIINESFSSIGRAYRIGGDEFAVIIRQACIGRIKEAVKTFAQKAQDFNQTAREYNLSIAYSLDKFNPKTDLIFLDLLKRVDRNMYIHKQKMKKDGLIEENANTDL